MSERIQILSAVHGIAPKSDELLGLAGDVERGRVPVGIYDERLAQEEADWLALQAEAGIDIRENGKLRWQDHLRPLVKAAAGFAGGIDQAPVTRWFETNTFYRKPTITGELVFDPQAFEAVAGRPAGSISLLEPHTFATLCENAFTELDLTENVLRFYSQILAYFTSCGVRRVILENYLKDTRPLPWPTHALDAARELALRHTELCLTLIAPGHEQIVIPTRPIPNLHVEAGLATLEHQARHIPQPFRPQIEGTEIWQQAVDTSHTNPDHLEISRSQIEALRRLRPARIVLTHTVDCERLPPPYAREKIKRLGEFAVALKTRLGLEV